MANSQSLELKVKYDEDKDVLDVSLGGLNDGFLVELEPNFTVKLCIESGDVIGYTIREYSNNVHKNKMWSEKLTKRFDDEADGAFYGKLLKHSTKVA